LNEARHVHTISLIQSFRQADEVEKVLDVWATGHGTVMLLRAKDGNAYIVDVRQARESPYSRSIPAFRKLLGVREGEVLNALGLAEDVETDDCPLNSRYGELPEVGGFSSATEYEIGLGRIAEAAHCILGSLAKGVRRDQPAGYRLEIGHISEEFDIIQQAIEEYGRDLYYGRLFDGSYKLGRDYAKLTVESIRHAASELKVRAESAKSRLGDYAPIIRELAVACYDLVIALADAALLSVKDYPDWSQSAFKDPTLRRKFLVLKNKVQDYVQNFQTMESEVCQALGLVEAEDEEEPKKGKVRRTFSFEGSAEDVKAIEKLLAWVHSLGAAGHSATAEISVDGDGSGRVIVREVGKDGKGKKLSIKSLLPEEDPDYNPSAGSGPELRVHVGESEVCHALGLTEGQQARLFLGIEGDWPDFRVNAWLKRDGWAARGVRLTSSKSEFDREGDEPSTYVQLEGPAEVLADLQRQRGGQVSPV